MTSTLEPSTVERRKQSLASVIRRAMDWPPLVADVFAAVIEALEHSPHDAVERAFDKLDATYALPTETRREYAARRQRCLDVRKRLAEGGISQINDLITSELLT